MPMKLPAPNFRDATGHVDPRYAADLQALSQAMRAEPPDPVAFFDANIRRDSLAEELGEGFVRTATSGDDEADLRDEDSLEEMGGPFVESTSAQEFAYDTDASNAEDVTPEPCP
jgi:hypothetical protein